MAKKREWIPGEKVRVRGFRNRAIVLRMMRDYKGGVLLDRPIDGFRLWNTDDLKPWKKPSKKESR